jgi:hypothetical protein
MAGESWVGFWPSFDCAWFTPAGAVGDRVIGELLKEIGEEFSPAVGTSNVGEGFGKPTSGSKGSGEAQPMTRQAMSTGAFQHEATDQIVNKEMDAQFPFSIGGILAAELIHL